MFWFWIWPAAWVQLAYRPASAIVEQLTGKAPTAKALNAAVDASLKGTA